MLNCRPALLLGLLSLSVPLPAQAVESETVMIEMRDGVHLATELFYPSDARTVPILLMRSPYGREFIPLEAAEIICDGLGYGIAVQDVRGRGGSEGIDDVFMSDGWAENQDGYDTIDWLVHQPFSDGQVGMLGVSALGISTYLAAGALHPALKAAHVGISASEFYEQAVFQGGVFREALVTDWLAGQGSSHMLSTFQEHPVYDALWASLDLRSRYAMIDTPIFHWGGFHDIFAEGPLAAFSALQRGGEAGIAGPQRLIMGPWTHIDRGAWARVQGELEYPANSLMPLGELAPFAWYDRFMKPEDARPGDRRDPFPVRLYVMGPAEDLRGDWNRWERAATWPLPAQELRLNLTPEGGLTRQASAAAADPLDFVHDPAAPLPTIGGRELSLPAGPRDQSALIGRPDVLVFETEPLAEPVKVVGTVTATLFISSSAPDTDLAVRLTDVYPDGRAMLVADGILRARHRDSFEEESFLSQDLIVPMEVEIGSTAQVFGPGHRIQILVSSSNNRRFQVNPGTGGDVFDEDDTGAPALNTLFVDALFQSHLSLPIPLKGASEPADMTPEPTAAAIARVRAKAQRGAHLSWEEREILGAQAARLLFEAMAERTTAGGL